MIINTSFNVRGEPIVCTPEDAYRCFMRTDMDALVLGPFVLHKSDQPAWKETENWKRSFNSTDTMSHPQTTVTNRELRQFGLLVGAVFVGLFGCVAATTAWSCTADLAPSSWACSLLILGLFSSRQRLRPIYRRLDEGWRGPWLDPQHARIILGAIFFLVVTPMGLIMRLFGHNPMSRVRDPQAKSYRHPSATRCLLSHMEGPLLGCC